jgi:hypothetical protein
MQASEHAQATAHSPSIGPPPVRRAELSPTVGGMDRLRRSKSAGRGAAALGSLALAGLIALALCGIGFAGIGRSLSNVHPWWNGGPVHETGSLLLLQAADSPR